MILDKSHSKLFIGLDGISGRVLTRLRNERSWPYAEGDSLLLRGYERVEEVPSSADTTRPSLEMQFHKRTEITPVRLTCRCVRTARELTTSPRARSSISTHGRRQNVRLISQSPQAIMSTGYVLVTSEFRKTRIVVRVRRERKSPPFILPAPSSMTLLRASLEFQTT